MTAVKRVAESAREVAIGDGTGRGDVVSPSCAFAIDGPLDHLPNTSSRSTHDIHWRRCHRPPEAEGRGVWRGHRRSRKDKFRIEE